jgi:replicative DNA helicase
VTITDTDPLERVEPHDLAAEQAHLGTVLANQKHAGRILQLVAPADYYRPAHALIHAAATTLLDRGEPANPITVAAQLQATGQTMRAGGPDYLNTCLDLAATPTSADWYAHRIRSLAQRRALMETGMKITQMAADPRSGESGDLAETAVNLTRQVRDAGRAADDTPITDIHDFLAIEDTYDWVLPGLIERGDRLMLTSGEGGGKSTLLRQFAITAAAGAMPFGNQPNHLGPQNVLVLDCENSAPQSRRRYRALMNTAERLQQPVKRGHLHIDCRPEGVDLTRADGRAWLMRRVEAAQPDLLIIGPVYQLHAGDPNSEEQARKITVALTEARLAGRGCAMLMEAHAAKASGFGPRSLAPVGSSLWLRWPEFGFGLRPVEDERSADQDRARRVVPWRGLRDERAFPKFVRQGDPGDWPWIAYRPSDADDNGNSATGVAW